MRDFAGGLAERGVNLYAITTGTPEHTADFCSSREVPMTCLTDHPGEPGYAAFGLVRVGMRTLFGPSVRQGVLTAVRRWREVELPRSGDPYRMSGTFVLDGRGEIRFAHRDEHPNDHAETSTLVACLDEIG